MCHTVSFLNLTKSLWEAADAFLPLLLPLEMLFQDLITLTVRIAHCWAWIYPLLGHTYLFLCKQLFFIFSLLLTDSSCEFSSICLYDGQRANLTSLYSENTVPQFFFSASIVFFFLWCIWSGVISRLQQTTVFSCSTLLQYLTWYFHSALWSIFTSVKWYAPTVQGSSMVVLNSTVLCFLILLHFIFLIQSLWPFFLGILPCQHSAL